MAISNKFDRMCVSRMAWLMPLAAIIANFVNLTAFAGKTCTPNPSQGYFCGDGCQTMTANGWQNELNVECLLPPSTTQLCSNLTNIANKPSACPPGAVRIRRFDKNNNMAIACAQIEACAGSAGTTVRLCTHLAASGYYEYHCVSCPSNKVNGAACATH